MATSPVNLDALIPREDFEVPPDEAVGEWATVQTIQIRDLEKKTFFYNALRKPDFQRETANWSPDKIQDFVRTFLDGDLIPAIILWKSGKNIFVIDGAHRLSALIAWVQNDFGDGKESREFFENKIPREQQSAAEATRRLIKQRLGTYDEHTTAVDHAEQSRPEVVDALVASDRLLSSFSGSRAILKKPRRPFLRSTKRLRRSMLLSCVFCNRGTPPTRSQLARSSVQEPVISLGRSSTSQSATRSNRWLKRKQLYASVLDGIYASRVDEDILASLRSDLRFSFLVAQEAQESRHRRDFDTDTKSEVFLRQALETRCGVKSAKG